MEQDRCATSGDALEILRFTYHEDWRNFPVRIVMLAGEPWFIARDVCDVTGALMVNAIYRDRDCLLVEETSLRCDGPDELPIAESGGVWLLSEPRVYELASRPREGRCWDFKRWVMHEVLPTIRRLNPSSNERVDLPVTQEAVQVAALLKSAGSDLESPDKPIKKKRKPRARKPQPHALYRFFDERDRLLYVGESWSAPSRAKQHRAGQRWWKQVRRMTVEMHPCRDDALAAEAEAIRTEHPRYNRAGVVKRGA